MPNIKSKLSLIFALAVIVELSGCAGIPSSGPSSKDIQKTGQETSQKANAAGIQIVDLTEELAGHLSNIYGHGNFLKTLGDTPGYPQELGIGDAIEINIWEAPPATLFGASAPGTTMGAATSRPTNIPVQVIDSKGKIFVPFVGEVAASGLTISQFEEKLRHVLSRKANDPQVIVRRATNSSSFVTVIGDIPTSIRMQLTPHGERVLDAIAEAGGIRQPVNKMTVQLTRGKKVVSLPLETVIKDPLQNIELHPKDVVTLVYQPYSITTLGAVGQTHEVPFEVQGISLAQALSRSGGLDDNRSDAKGVFVFRFENKNDIAWKKPPQHVLPNGTVPVIYRLDLKNPNSIFIAQTFVMRDKDMLYVSNAPVSEMQKITNIVLSFVYPITSIGVMAR